MLVEIIKADLKQAMLNKDVARRDLLRVILSEINKIDKLEKTRKVGGVVADEEVHAICKKGIESAKECHTEFEIPYYEQYLPKHLSDQEYWDILMLAFYGLDKTNVGELMKAAKTVLGSSFDGRRVQAVIKQL